MPLLPYLLNNLVPNLPLIIPVVPPGTIKSYIFPLDGFMDFIAVFPSWRLVFHSEDNYSISYLLIPQDVLTHFNPDTAIIAGGVKPNNTLVIKGGAYAPFNLSAIRNITFDGTILMFRYAGQILKCNGLKGTISVSKR